MRTSSYTQETMVIENPSKPLVMLMNKLRDRKMAQLKVTHPYIIYLESNIKDM